MSFILLIIAFTQVFFSIALNGKHNAIYEIFVKAILSFSLLIVAITEVLSIYNGINYFALNISWVIVNLILCVILFSQRGELIKFLNNSIKEIQFKSFDKVEKIILLVLFLLLILILFQGIIYPPNNWDSMTYHLARVHNWIQNESVNHYPTNISRQLYQPPFAEFVILHFNILSSGDYLSNSLQWIFLIASVIAIICIVKQFTNNKKILFLTIILSVTIPEALLQASNTKNDLVLSFFILSAIYFLFKLLKSRNNFSLFWFSLAMGLAVLTKGTSYIYLLPVLILIFYIIIKYTLVKPSFLFIALVYGSLAIFINSGHYLRNYKLTGNLLGVDNSEMNLYSNEKLTPPLLFSNLMKNSLLHSGIYPINAMAIRITKKVHEILNIPLNNPETNFNNLKVLVAPDIPNNEDTASNFIHFSLILLSVILILLNFVKERKFGILELLMLIIITQILIFNFFLKWQPWHTRLHTPIFLLSVPLISLILERRNVFISHLNKLSYLLIISAYFVVLFNYTRPIISTWFTSGISIHDSRYKKYFAISEGLYDEYRKVSEIIKDANSNLLVGLDLREDDWEYPLFRDINAKTINTIHINAISSPYKLSTNQQLDYIISTKIREPIINYNNQAFVNVTVEHKHLYLFYRRN